MKIIMSALYRALCHFSIAFSGIILFFWRFMSDNGLPSLKPESISVFATFALIFGISSLIFAIPKIPNIMKTVLHFVTNTIGFLSTFVAIDGTTQLRAFVAGAFFVILYIVVYLIAYLLKKLANRNTGKEQ